MCVKDDYKHNKMLITGLVVTVSNLVYVKRQAVTQPAMLG